MGDELIHVEIVFDGALVLEVRAHGEHHMTCEVVAILRHHCMYKLFHSVVHVIFL